MSEWIDYFRGLSKNSSKHNGGSYNNDYIAFWDVETQQEQPLLKMAMGLLKDENKNCTIPGIVFGAGDTQGKNRAYIEKNSLGLDIFLRSSEDLVARVRLGNDGKVYVNETEFQAFGENNPVPSVYIEEAELWNKKLSGLTYDSGSYYVGTSKLYDGAVTNSKVSSLSADKITGGTISGVLFKTIGDSGGSSGNHLQIGTIGGIGGNIDFYYGTEKRGTIQQVGGSFQMFPGTNATMTLGISDRTTYPKGAWNCDDATFDNLYNSDGYQYVTNNAKTESRYLAISPGTHNHGIPHGTWLRTADGGSVQWSEATLSISPESHSHYIADY